MDSFEFETGRVLKNVEVEYETFGTPKYDDEGYIINLIVSFSTFKDQYSFLRNSHNYIKENGGFTDEFYFVVITSLGSPNSCSPSTTGLNHNFPIYTVKDIVNFKRQFLKEKYKIKQILGLVGEGLSGYEIFTWACEYPDEMEFIFTINSSFKNTGYRYLLAKCFENIIEITDEIYTDTYSSSLSRTLIALNSLILAQTASKKTFNNMDKREIDVLLDDFIEEGLLSDIYDLKFKNDCILEFDVEDKLSNVKAKSLIIGNNSNYFDYEHDAMPLKELIKNSVVLTYNFEPENYYFEDSYYEKYGKEVIEFITQFKR